MLQCPTFNSRFTSSLLNIAHLLEEGGVCGIPTDTVYALAASCKNPEAIEKIYNIKVSLRKQARRKYSTNLASLRNSSGCCLTFQERPAEKPICICISNIEQLLAAKPPFSPLLWEFMRNVYPGGISCIVSKGDWLLRLGLKSSVKWLKNTEKLK